VTDVLLRTPEAWPVPLVAAGAMVTLAVLDFAGAVLAKEWVSGRAWAGVAGLAVFGVLFWAYASSLRYSDLATVTLGWIVVLQVGIVLLDRFRYGVTLPTGKWVAVVCMVGAEAYLLLGPAGERAGS